MTNENLLPIFNEIKALMKKYEKGTFVALSDNEAKYDLWSKKQYHLFGKMREEIYFAEIKIQSGYVGFYFFPIYAFPEETNNLIEPELLKLLKGKTCFHVKKYDKEIMAQIKSALKKGYDSYKEKGIA